MDRKPYFPAGMPENKPPGIGPWVAGKPVPGGQAKGLAGKTGMHGLHLRAVHRGVLHGYRGVPRVV